MPTQIKTLTDAHFHPDLLESLQRLEFDPAAVEDTADISALPNLVWVVRYSNGAHGVAAKGDVHGLVICKEKAHLHSFIRLVKEPPTRSWVSERISRETAFEIARSKGEPISALILYKSASDLTIYPLKRQPQ